MIGNNNKVQLFCINRFLSQDNSNIDFEYFFELRWGLNWISKVSSVFDHRFYSVLWGICGAWRYQFFAFLVSGYKSIPLLVISPVARDYVAGVCASSLFYLTYLQRVYLARDPENLKTSLEYPRCFDFWLRKSMHFCVVLL